MLSKKLILGLVGASIFATSGFAGGDWTQEIDLGIGDTFPYKKCLMQHSAYPERYFLYYKCLNAEYPNTPITTDTDNAKND